MFKKGLVTLVCLAVMSALWSWATATYSISTKINSLGTKPENGFYVPVVGGSVKTRIDGAADYIVGNQTNGTMYTTVTTDKLVDVEIAAADGYKIASVTKTTAGVTTTLVGATDYARAFTVDNVAADTKTQFITVTFAADTQSQVTKKTWQLQATNNNGGGSITLTRANVAAAPYSTVGKPLVKNYIDTTPVTVTAAPAAGYFIDYVVVNGVKDNTDRDVASYDIATVDGANRLNTFNVGYKKKSIPVNTANGSAGGIAPLNPVADPYGAVRLIITPTGVNPTTGISYNSVTGVTVTGGGTLALTDRFGTPVTNLATTPFVGPLKATITGITGPVTVTATYGTDAAKTASVQSCTNTCHLDPALVEAKPYVKAAATQWGTSAHSANSVTCVTCHTTMPGDIVKGSVDQTTFNVTDAKAGAIGSNYCSRCHAASVNKVLASAHYTKPSGALVCTDCHAAGHNPAGNREACANCHGYINNHTAENTAGKGCVECHDKHNPATITGTLGTPSAHPAVTLYTFEEIGMQMAGGARVPVQVDANGKGMPYSPKQTCGTSGCHVKGGVDYTYDKISDHAFHSNEGRSEYQDSATGKFDATKNKPWVQSAAMVGKW